MTVRRLLTSVCRIVWPEDPPVVHKGGGQRQGKKGQQFEGGALRAAPSDAAQTLAPLAIIDGGITPPSPPKPPLTNDSAIQSLCADFEREPGPGGTTNSVALEAWNWGSLSVRASSHQGRDHQYGKIPRQDAIAIETSRDGTLLALALADGLGSKRLSHFGSQLAAFNFTRTLGRQPNQMITADSIVQAVITTSELIRRQLGEQLGPTCDPHDFLSTFLGGAMQLIDGVYFLVAARVGGSDDLWRLRSGKWECITRDTGSVDVVQAVKGTVLPLKLKQSDVECWSLEVVPGDAIFFMSDGLGNPMKSNDELANYLARNWTQPPDIGHFVVHMSFDLRGEMDDRSCIGLWVN
jgi:serine/threonine protein phosphatase PrpC